MLTSILRISCEGDRGSGREGKQGGVPTENVTSEQASNVSLQHVYKPTPNIDKTNAERKVEWAISREDTKIQE